MSDLTKDQVVDWLSGQSVIEIAELVKELEDKWGVSAAAPAAVPYANSEEFNADWHKVFNWDGDSGDKFPTKLQMAAILTNNPAGTQPDRGPNHDHRFPQPFNQTAEWLHRSPRIFPVKIIRFS